MEKEHLKFINNILKPWEELNSILSQPYAIQSDLSDFTRKVENLSISISHYEEIKKGSRKPKNLMNDLADTTKHGTLHDLSRITDIQIRSCFICNDENKFCFLRNIPFIKYKNQENSEEYDFMKESLKEIFEIMKELNINFNREIKIKESDNKEYTEEATLTLNQKYCINTKQMLLFFIKKNNMGQLMPYDPPIIKFKVLKDPNQ